MVSCSEKEETPPSPVPPLPQILEIAGGVLKIKANEAYKDLITEEIKLDTGENVPDNTMFRVVSEDLMMSIDRVDWYKDMLVPSIDGKVTVSVRPETHPALYRITVYPVTSETIKFQSNLSGRFFIEVSPGDPFVILDLTAEKFEDLPPYNNVKELNESWVISADPNIVQYISVGPIQDQFGNRVSEGQIQLNISEGSIVSNNPAPIADGYAYFSYRPTVSTNELTVTSLLTGLENISLNKTVGMKLVRPDLDFLEDGDFTGMSDGETRDVVLTLKNKGSQPATNLSLTVTAPYILLPEQADSCKDRQTLKSQETCLVRIRYTRLIHNVQNGYLQAIGQPSNFPSSIGTAPLTVSAIEPAKLVLSQGTINFPQTQCGIKTTLDIFVTNTGSFPATNVFPTQPPSSVSGYGPFFKIILPPEDMSNPDMNAIVDCGTTFPPGRKCRVRIEYQPESISPSSPVQGYLGADGLSPVAINFSGSAIAGPPSGNIPVSFLTPGNFIPTDSMWIANGQRTIVRVGPMADSCGNSVANGLIISGSVTGGTLNTLTTTTNNGYADFIWNSQAKAELFGNQYITIASAGYSVQHPLLFKGVNLSVTGLTDWGQVIVEKPRKSNYTITNTGNVKAETINIIASSPLNVTDMGTCVDGVNPGSSCQFELEARPSGNQDYPAALFVSSATLGLNQGNLSNILIVGRHKPNLVFNSNKYLFNDGGSGGTVSRSITITNQGPSISRNSVITVEAPYSISANTCPSNIGVQQSCQVTVVANRTSSLNAGFKTIRINNEVEDDTATAILGFGELQFSQEAYVTKQYYCVGPFTIKSIGINNEVRNLSSSTVIDLTSSNNQIIFYNEATCNTKATSTMIFSNTNTSTPFYIRSLVSEATIITGSYSALPPAERSFSFSDIKTESLPVIPQLAIKDGSCIMCHSSVKANIYTDMGFTGNMGAFHGLGSPGSGNQINTNGFNGTSDTYGGVDQGYGTSFIQGTIFTPKLNFTPTAKTYLQNMIVAGKGTVNLYNGSTSVSQTVYKSTAPTVIDTVADYLNSTLFHRTSSYLNFLLNWGSGLFSKTPSVSPTQIAVREIPSIHIGWPITTQITSFIDNPGTFKYYKWEEDSPDLTNFGEVDGKYFTNLNPATPIVCDGDLFVDGVVLLNNLKVETNTGCRIYATKTVFVQADSTPDKQGVEYVDQDINGDNYLNPNLQITSSKGIMMGVGKCPNVENYLVEYVTDKGIEFARKYGMFGYRSSRLDDPSPKLTTFFEDYDKMTDSGGNIILNDASSCAPLTVAPNNRRVHFNKVLFNAPRIDSRYTGKITGSIITGTGSWSKGKFNFEYGPHLNFSPILPFINHDTFFKVQDCVVNGIDQSIALDDNYKACPSN